jgi:hypothetical protein
MGPAMKTVHTLPLALALLIPFGCAGNHAPRTGPGGTPTVLSLLHQRQPRTAWEEKSLVQADFDQDGTVDYALRGLSKDRVVVGIVQGPLAAKSKVWTLEFPWGKGTQDSLCSNQAKIEVESLDDEATAGNRAARKAKPRPPAQGISLYDDRCDAFHIAWSPADRKFTWWRL